MAFESDLWINPDAPLSGDRIQKICQQQFPGYADDDVFHSYSIDMDTSSQTTMWTVDGGAASASCSGFAFLPTQVVFYARSSDDGNSMVAQIRNITFSTTGKQPDFSISVSPTNQLVVRSGGWNASVSVVLRSVNGFDGTVGLSADTADPAIIVNFDRNSVPLNSSGSPFLVKVNVSIVPQYANRSGAVTEWPALGKYQIVVKAQSGDLSHQVSLTVDIRAAIKGLMNILQFGGIGRISSSLSCLFFAYNLNCFTSQQNFWIEAPNGTRVFWAQNVAFFAPLNVGRCLVSVVGKCLYHVTVFKGWELLPAFEVFPAKDLGHPILQCFPALASAGNLSPSCSGNFVLPRFVTTPFAVNFTSIIVGNKLRMSNDATTVALGTPSATLSIPDGSFIVGSPIGHYDPEMVVVGPPGASCSSPSSVDFLSDTYGHLSSRELLFGSKSWETPIGRVLQQGVTQTCEFSTNLKWTETGEFYYVDPSLGHPATDQGLALQPDYNTSISGAG